MRELHKGAAEAAPIYIISRASCPVCHPCGHLAYRHGDHPVCRLCGHGRNDMEDKADNHACGGLGKIGQNRQA